MEPYALPIRPLPQTAAEQRIGDAERNLVCDQLSAAFAAGRLDQVELEERLALAVSARTRLEIHLLVRDLGLPPRPRPAGPPPGYRPAWTGVDIVAVLMLLSSSLAIIGLLLVVAMEDGGLLLAAMLGGGLAFVAGVSASHLTHRWTRRLRESVPPGS